MTSARRALWSAARGTRSATGCGVSGVASPTADRRPRHRLVRAPRVPPATPSAPGRPVTTAGGVSRPAGSRTGAAKEVSQPVWQLGPTARRRRAAWRDGGGGGRVGSHQRPAVRPAAGGALARAAPERDTPPPVAWGGTATHCSVLQVHRGPRGRTKILSAAAKPHACGRGTIRGRARRGGQRGRAARAFDGGFGPRTAPAAGDRPLPLGLPRHPSVRPSCLCA